MDIEKFDGIEIELNFEDIVKNTCEELSQNIKDKALSMFDGKGDYAKSWTYRLDKDGKGGVVYNKDHYRLSHLLEHGHTIKNKYGTYGRTSPAQHIEPCYKESKEEYIEKMSSCSYKVKLK